ncbi:MAG: glutamate 5-kinase [Acidobacteria bacterium]|nr:glutamate 5-kinase [Acidobacteriota bacterium]
MKTIFEQAHRIIIKVGSSLIIGENNRVREEWLKTVAEDIAHLRGLGKQVTVITSGAVGLGRQTLRYGARKLELEEKQAAAACGQITLISHWAKAFQFENSESFYPAQILLTLDDSENRRRYLNARSTLETLLAEPHIIPIVNENDTVATEELKVGDNDRLAARVAQMISADLLVLLSDIDGLYVENPFINPAAEFIPEVSRITTEIEAMAGGSGSMLGSGGMRTKIEAAKIALAAGCHMLIGKGAEMHPLERLMKGERCTSFRAGATPKSARKHWISGSLKALGVYTVDEGAAAALQNGKSLLPAGVREVEGAFERGDAVIIKSLRGEVLGKGLSAYSSIDAKRIIGARSSEIEKVLGFKYRDTLVHRDDMVLEISGRKNI